MKKAQTEIMGLAIVVILIVLGATFVIRQIITKEPVDYKKEFTQAELASNMLNTLLETTAKDCDYTITELLQNCGQSGSIECNNMGPCQYVEETAKHIFSKTLEEWNIGYEFKAYDSINEKFVLGKTCIGNKKSKIFPIPTGSGTLSVRLDICG